MSLEGGSVSQRDLFKQQFCQAYDVRAVVIRQRKLPHPTGVFGFLMQKVDVAPVDPQKRPYHSGARNIFIYTILEAGVWRVCVAETDRAEQLNLHAVAAHLFQHELLGRIQHPERAMQLVDVLKSFQVRAGKTNLKTVDNTGWLIQWYIKTYSA